jgi:hypothetical protein
MRAEVDENGGMTGRLQPRDLDPGEAARIRFVIEDQGPRVIARPDLARPPFSGGAGDHEGIAEGIGERRRY